MQFRVVDRGGAEPVAPAGTCFLVIDRWDDYSFKTTFDVQAADANGNVIYIGVVKIGRFGMKGGPRIELPPVFDRLGDQYFSVGQDADYYENLTTVLGPELRAQFLDAIRDVAADRGLFERAREEEVMQSSLLRSVSAVSVEGQFRRLARGEARVLAYDFAYHSLHLDVPAGDGMQFSVRPGSNPPTNIHAIIGGNGAGKTRMIERMSRALSEPAFGSPFGEMTLADGSTDFSGIVNVSFSAFDELDTSEDSEFFGFNGPKRRYIGLRIHDEDSRSEDSERATTKSLDDLTDEFIESLRSVRRTESLTERWLRAIETLTTDPLLRDASLPTWVLEKGSLGEARISFKSLSSGHKIVLLTVTRLVELVEERTLVFMDEPESHLHPPLLSAFVNALSALLSETNGVAIAATHSPVVLQEVPKSCVWVLRRSGLETVARRPSLETFGENVGELTQDVFRLEVTKSGFHARLRNEAESHTDYRSLLDAFDGELGSEARALAQLLVSTTEDED